MKGRCDYTMCLVTVISCKLQLVIYNFDLKSADLQKSLVDEFSSTDDIWRDKFRTIFLILKKI